MLRAIMAMELLGPHALSVAGIVIGTQQREQTVEVSCVPMLFYFSIYFFNNIDILLKHTKKALLTTQLCLYLNY